MKKLLLLFAFPAATIAQAPINTYMGQLCPDCNEFNSDGVSQRTYMIVESATPLDESATGANITWDFSGLMEMGASHYDNIEATPAQISAYPNTTYVMNVDPAGQVYFANPTTLTALVTDAFELDYSANNATMGTLPFNYGYSNVDNVAGNYLYDTYSGSFTGTLTTSVDAYGTLSMPAFMGVPHEVTRLKTVQELDISYFPFGNVGEVTITTYHYYDNDSSWLWPQFRSTTTSISVPLLGINETTTIYEAQVQAFLRNPDIQEAQASIYPNPVKDALHIAMPNTEISGISISDAAGKTVLSKKGEISEIDLSSLRSGIYFCRIESATGTIVKKFVKN